MKKRFVSWAAVSSMPQAKKISLEDQLVTNRDHAARHDGEIVSELVVPGESRYIILFEDACRRVAAYAQLDDLIKRKAFDVLIYLDRSRLGRRATLSMAVIELCHDAGILTYEVENPPASLDNLTFSHDEMLIGAIKSVGAQREIQKFQDRHKMGMIARIKKGNFPTGLVPYGWTEVFDKLGNSTIEINEEAALVIQTIFNLYLHHNMGMLSIAEELNRRGFKTPEGKKWANQNVHQFFDRVWRYAAHGEVNVRSKDRPYVRALGNWPAIINEETAFLILEEKARRKDARRAVSNTYRFSLCVFCDECGNRMSYNVTRRIKNTDRMQCVLKCVAGSTRSSPKYTPHRHSCISEYKIVDAVRDFIEYVRQPGAIEKALEQMGSVDFQSIEQEMSEAKARISQLEKQVYKLDEMYIKGDLDDARYRVQIERIKEQLKFGQQSFDNALVRKSEMEYQKQSESRLNEVAESGFDMLELEDLKIANGWMKRNLKIFVADCEVTRVLVTTK